MKIRKLIAINIVTGVSLALISGVVFTKEHENLGTIIVNDNTKTIKERDQQGYDNQYDKNESNIYIGKDLVDRYKGTNPADVLNSAVGVYSGDSRNSGAIDPNIRGIQGQGRVPVTVDGTEQALTVWRGYNGANNRNYIDPNMISSITIHKSASLDPDVKTSIGGGVAIRTLNIDDIVEPDEIFGFDLKLETSSNSTKPRLPNLQTGSDYRDDPAIMKNLREGDRASYLFNDPALLISRRPRGDANFFNLKDNAVRIAVGTRQERFNVMAAYSYRDQGNYFSGTRGANDYKEPINSFDEVNPSKGIDPYLPFAANIFAPGHEVTNTSSELKSYLVKANLVLSESQKLSLGYTDTISHYGEIMPSRISFRDLNDKVPQWTLAKYNIQAFNVNYRLNPEANPYINMKIGYWMTKATSDTNTSGSFPREPIERDLLFEMEMEPRNLNIDGTLVHGAMLNAINKRQGFNLSNKMALLDTLDLTLMGSFTKETIDSKNDIFGDSATPKSNIFGAIPREGERQENTLAFNFEWRPTNWLNISAGAQRTGYWSQDHLLSKRRDAKDLRFAKSDQLVAQVYNVSRTITQEEYSKIVNYTDFKGRNLDTVKDSPYYLQLFVEGALGLKPHSLEDAGFQPTFSQGEFRINEKWKAEWRLDSNNKFTRETNPFYNGTIDTKEQSVDPFTGKVAKTYIPAYALGSRDRKVINRIPDDQKFSHQEKRRAHAWAPAFSASAYLTDNDRIYTSYTETVRMPSIFEDTVGFSGILGPALWSENTQPERAKTIEVGYVRNMQQLLGAERFADIRINYYHTAIENAFERDSQMIFTQVDHHTTSGIELQARYDNGNYFGDFGLDYRLKNEVCDSASIAALDPFNQYNMSECVEAGFPGGYLRTQLQPKYSLKTSLGMRFLEERLEIGSRMRYHSSAENNDEKKMMGKYPLNYAPMNNSPMRWNPVFVADAYVSYTISKDTSMELLATNIFDEYYVDPLTRSMMPAPGRTLRLSFTSRF